MSVAVLISTHISIGWQVYNLIRGTNPAPGAWTTHDKAMLNIYDCIRTDGDGDGDGVAGRVMDINDQGVSIQCVGGRILVRRVKPEGQAKQGAFEWAAASGLSIGDTLGT